MTRVVAKISRTDGRTCDWCGRHPHRNEPSTTGLRDLDEPNREAYYKRRAERDREPFAQVTTHKHPADHANVCFDCILRVWTAMHYFDEAEYVFSSEVPLGDQA